MRSHDVCLAHLLCNLCLISQLLKSYIQFSGNTPPTIRESLKKSLGVQNENHIGSSLRSPMEIDGRSAINSNLLFTKWLRS